MCTSTRNRYNNFENLFTSIDEIDYFYVLQQQRRRSTKREARPNSIFIFDDVAYDKQDTMREYFSSLRQRWLLLSLSVVREDI